jgi:elongation factor G
MYEIDHTYKKLIGSAGTFARVRLRITPQAPGSGLTFVNSAGEHVPVEFIPGVKQGVRDALGARDLKVELIDGAYHDIDSSVVSFEPAAKQAITKAIRDFGL